MTSCQESLSLLEGPKHPNVLDAVRRLGIGLLCWAPLAGGFLVDGFTTDGLEPDDFRRSSPLAERSDESPHMRGTQPHGAGRCAGMPSPGCSSSRG